MSVQRKEFQETKVFRTVSPVRNTRSTQNLSQFDNNLDNLLEDLQSSVSRPGSSLGNTYRETTKTVNGFDSARTNSLNRVNHVKSSNPVTEYSSDDAYTYTSPDGSKKVESYKKESYSYKTGGDSSINQLDSLLDDLQQVKSSTFEKDSYNRFGADPGYSKEKVISGKKVVERELHYGDPPRSSSRSRTLERSERESSITRDMQYSSSEGTYGDLRTVRHSSPSPTRSNTSTLSKQTKVTNVHSYPMEVVETTAPDINPEILAQLDPHLLPTGNTKVTTTIKTYTYEIPGDAETTTTSEKYLHLNESQTTPSKSFVYSKAEKSASSLDRYNEDARWNREEKYFKETSTTHQPPYQKPSPPIGATDRTILKETITTRNYQPGYSPELARRTPPGKQSYIYNETTTTKNYNQNQNGYHDNRNNQPPRDVYVTKQTQTTNVEYPRPANQTVVIRETRSSNVENARPANQTVVYRERERETQSTNNYSQGGGSDGELPPKDTVARRIEVFESNKPPQYGFKHPEPVNITYKYQSHSSTTNNMRSGYPPETEPLLPQKFPREPEIGGPPKGVDELMATIGGEPPNSPYNAGYTAHEAELQHQKKVEVLKHQHEVEVQKKEPKDLPKTKNVTGPPVYYPPGEMFAKKEEAAWRAQGAMAKEKEKYEYESKEKSKTGGGRKAAIVPVCLPLCCGLPCTII